MIGPIPVLQPPHLFSKRSSSAGLNDACSTDDDDVPEGNDCEAKGTSNGVIMTAGPGGHGPADLALKRREVRRVRSQKRSKISTLTCRCRSGLPHSRDAQSSGPDAEMMKNGFRGEGDI